MDGLRTYSADCRYSMIPVTTRIVNPRDAVGVERPEGRREEGRLCLAASILVMMNPGRTRIVKPFVMPHAADVGQPGGRRGVNHRYSVALTLVMTDRNQRGIERRTRQVRNRTGSRTAGTRNETRIEPRIAARMTARTAVQTVLRMVTRAVCVVPVRQGCRRSTNREMTPRVNREDRTAGPELAGDGSLLVDKVYTRAPSGYSPRGGTAKRTCLRLFVASFRRLDGRARESWKTLVVAN